jgi:hypothetical protein
MRESDASTERPSHTKCEDRVPATPPGPLSDQPPTLRSDSRSRRSGNLRSKVGLNLAIEATGTKSEQSLTGLVVLVAAVGAEVRLVHNPSLRPPHANWVARYFEQNR